MNKLMELFLNMAGELASETNANDNGLRECLKRIENLFYMVCNK